MRSGCKDIQRFYRYDRVASDVKVFITIARSFPVVRPDGLTKNPATESIFTSETILYEGHESHQVAEVLSERKLLNCLFFAYKFKNVLSVRICRTLFYSCLLNEFNRAIVCGED